MIAAFSAAKIKINTGFSNISMHNLPLPYHARPRRQHIPIPGTRRPAIFRTFAHVHQYSTMVQQAEFTLRPRSRGFHLVTDEVLSHLPPLPDAGLVHLFVKHTSAGLSINENADPDVRNDLGAIFDRLVGEREVYYTHTLEGDDDMPAHAKSTLTGVELTVPVTRGRLNLGTWQGIYLCEFRNRAPGRRIVATIIG